MTAANRNHWKARAQAAEAEVARLREALRGLLLSADASWEQSDAGHDWREACVTARSALSLSSEPKAGAVDGGWRPIETAPKDGTVIQRQHVMFKAPISVRWVPDNKAFKYQGRILNWMEATYAQAWPEEAFTPHWQPLPSPPRSPR